jgi:hypothetical protein
MVFRFAPLAFAISLIVTCPRSRQSSRICTDNSGRSPNRIRSHASFFSRRNARGQVTTETYGNGAVKTLGYDTVTGWLQTLAPRLQRTGG